MAYFGWTTDKNDIRPEWPDYITEFSKQYKKEESKLGINYRKLWN